MRLHPGTLEDGLFFLSPPSNISSIEEFRRLIFDRLVVRVKACSLYEECEYQCSTDSGDCEGPYEPS